MFFNGAFLYFRTLAIFRPLSCFQWRTIKRAKTLITATVIASTLYSLIYIHTTEYLGPRACLGIPKNDKVTACLPVIVLAIQSIVPFVSILVMNIININSLCKRKAVLQQIGMRHATSQLSETKRTLSTVASINITDISIIENHNTASRVNGQHNGTRETSPVNTHRQTKHPKQHIRQGENTHVAITLLAVSFAFLILSLPTTARNILYALGALPSDQSRETNLTVAITSRLLIANSAINFWLYLLSGHKFKRDFKNLICICVK